MSELIKSESDGALEFVEYCNGPVKWHFANITPADREVTDVAARRPKLAVQDCTVRVSAAL